LAVGEVIWQLESELLNPVPCTEIVVPIGPSPGTATIVGVRAVTVNVAVAVTPPNPTPVTVTVKGPGVAPPPTWNCEDD